MRNINSTLLDKSRTSIFIAHRLRTVVDAGHLIIFMIAFKFANALAVDWIIVLNDGQVVEQGSHDELLRLGGLYYSMWMQQAVTDVDDP
jgi:ATP-binding cassette, subfamily B (MDR/TAP), member 7